MRPFLALGVLFLGAATLQPYSTERARVGEATDEVPRDHLTLRERLGYATLLRAGYVDVRLVDDVPDPSDSVGAQLAKQRNAYIAVEERRHGDLACIENFPPLPLPGVGTVDVRRLVMAIVAAERYNRSESTRRLEFAAADVARRTRGTLPDYSYGVGQLRLSHARDALRAELGDAPLGDADVLALLRDDCQNVRLVARHVAMLVERSAAAASVDAVVRAVARDYGGVRTPSVHGLMYEDAVAGAYALLNPPVFSEEMAVPDSAAVVPVTDVVWCATFANGSVTPRLDTTFQREGDSASYSPGSPEVAGPLRAGTARVRVSLLQRETGPRAYVAALAERRHQQLAAALERAGVPRTAISRADDAPITTCGAEYRGKEAIALVTLQLGAEPQRPRR